LGVVIMRRELCSNTGSLEQCGVITMTNQNFSFDVDIDFSDGQIKNSPGKPRYSIRFQPGDRIAIKRMLGQGSPKIEVRALGTVKEVDTEDKRVYIHWA